MATLHLVSTPIGHLDDITLRARDVLASSDLVLAEDTRRTGVLLDHLGVDARLRSLHEHNEAERIREVLDLLEGDADLALVSDAGTPLVSDPGRRLVRAAMDAGHRIVPVPGPSAVLAALVVSGLPTDRFAFLGFPPRKGRERRETLHRVAVSSETVVLFESPERLTRLLSDLEEVCEDSREASVARELTKVHEEVRRGTIAELRRYYESNSARGEVTVVVGAAAERSGPDAVDERAAGALALALLDEGMRPSGAARELARRLDVPRNDAYRIVHEVADDVEDDPT